MVSSVGAAAKKYGGILTQCACVATELLASSPSWVVLHGIHYGNVLDFKERGWLAIDSQRVIGECGFDYANLFCNPELVTAAFIAMNFCLRGFVRRLVYR